MDSYQTQCILAGRVKNSGCDAILGWEACRRDLNACNASQMAQMVAFEQAFVRTFRASAAAAAHASPGSSGFLYSCHNHVAGDSPLFSEVVVGNRAMSAAVGE